MRLSLLILLLLMMPILAYAQTEILRPFSWCPDYQIQFVSQTPPMSGYKLYLPKSLTPLEWQDSLIVLERKSDLLSVDWMLTQNVQNFCGAVAGYCNPKEVMPIDPDFYLSVQSILSKMPLKSNECDELAETLALQKEIETLNRDDIFKYKKPIRARNIFKLLKPELSTTIDLFSRCGGKKGSEQFVKNAILIELANSCMIPRPPGSFSWDEANVLAGNVAKDYQQISLLKVSKLEEEIKFKTVKTFARELIRQQAKDYVPQVDEFVDSMPLWQSLDENLKVKGYYENLMSLDATFEVVERMVPYVVESQLKSKIPSSNPAILADVQARAKQEYERCVRPYKEKYKFGYPTKDRIQNAVDLKANLCKKITCSENMCVGDPLLSETIGIKDTDVLTSCIYSSITQSLFPIVKESVALSLMSSEERSKATPDELMVVANASEKITDHGMVKLQECLDSKYPGFYQPKLGNQSLSFVKPGAPDFATHLLLCVDDMTVDVGRGSSGFIVEQNIKSYFPDSGAQVSEEILKDSYDPCIKALQADIEDKKKLGDESASIDPARCEYLITVKTSERILETKFHNDYPERKSQIDLIVSDLKKCNQAGVDHFYSEIKTNPNSGGSDYTNQDTFLGQCAAGAIKQLAGVIAVDNFTSRVNELSAKGDLKFKKDILKQTPQVKASIENCFQEELGKYKSWGEFSTFLDDKTALYTITLKCETKTTATAVSQIFNYEAKGQIKKYEKDQLFPPKVTSETVLNDVAASLIVSEDLKVPKDLKGDERRTWIFEQAYLSYVNKNPKLKDPVTTYSNKLSTMAEDAAYQRVHENLFNKMTSLNKTVANDLRPNFSSSCFEKLNKTFFSKLPGSSADAGPSSPLDPLASNLMNGLNYFKRVDQVTYQSKLKAIKDLCAGSNLTFDSIKSSVLTEVMLKGQIFNGLETDFSQTVLAGILAEKDKIEEPNRDIKLKYIDYKYQKIQDLINSKLRNPKELEKILYANGALLKFGQDSFVKLASGDKSTKTDFAQLMLKQLFLDSKTGGFADQFAKFQLVASVGVEGVDKAIVKSKEHWASYVTDAPELGAKAYFNNPANIEKAVNWGGVSESSKKNFISKIYMFAVLPQTELPPIDSKKVEEIFYRKYYPEYGKNNASSIKELMAETILTSTISAKGGAIYNSQINDAQFKAFSLDSKAKYNEIKSKCEFQAEQIVKKEFASYSPKDKQDLQTYLVSKMLMTSVSKKGEDIVTQMGVETKIADGISDIVTTDFKDAIQDAMNRAGKQLEKIERGPKY